MLASVAIRIAPASADQDRVVAALVRAVGTGGAAITRE